MHTAHLFNQALGKLIITHPYHSLRGNECEILKVKEINGIRRYSLRTGDGVICVPESWTDRCHIQQNELENVPFDARHLVELSELLKSIKNARKI